MAEYFNTRMTLIDKIRNQQDEKSWEEFVYFYEKYIQKVVVSLGVCKEDVEDLSQKVLLALWKKLPEFKYQPEKCKFRTWMKSLIRSNVNDYFRKCGRYSRDQERAALKQPNEKNADHNSPEVYENADNEWKIHISQLAWENIRGDFSETVQACFMMLTSGSSLDDVVEGLGMKRNTAVVYRKRVVERLSREIRRLDEELG